MVSTARIVLLNGVGSSGKGSIAKALQKIAAAPFLHLQMDAFIEMMPESGWGHPDWLSFETLQEDGKPSVAIKTGPLAERVFRGMRHAVAAMARQGNNLIVDDVLLGGEQAEYAALLWGHELIRVGVLAPLDVLEARERQRGDRMIGLARWQFGRVHQGMSYDLEVDSSRATPEQCAEQIRQKFRL
ncbi:MAG TPA: chloramphenicol phosphotransferase [Dongiaceae bacterium]